MSKKFALVVGASGEIGNAICRNLAEAGWSLYLHYSSNKEACKHVMDDLEHLYPTQEFMLIQADMSEYKLVLKN